MQIRFRSYLHDAVLDVQIEHRIRLWAVQADSSHCGIE
jgi:hypothetical protein